MRNLLLILSYDGTDFYGWQKSKEGPTVEGEISAVLSKVLNRDIELQAASRTDRGVHADYQVVNFKIEKELNLKRIHISLNQLLPRSIRIHKVEFAEEHFHATLDSREKSIVTVFAILPCNHQNKEHIPGMSPPPRPF